MAMCQSADLSPQNRIYHRTARPVFLFYEYLVPPTALSEIVPFIGKTALEQGPWTTMASILRTPSCCRTTTCYGSSATRFLENKGLAVRLSPDLWLIKSCYKTWSSAFYNNGQLRSLFLDGSKSLSVCSWAQTAPRESILPRRYWWCRVRKTRSQCMCLFVNKCRFDEPIVATLAKESILYNWQK